ncbi:Strictosidine synthase [Platanthera guangdongensis]|uniref:Strictosidine synthase n=1 Tax=Platanthera guangdongensis TaxID=2320717 RepID=A0ABR2N0S4_9ASPA
MSRRIIIGCAVLAAVLSLILHVAINSPVSPQPFSPPSFTFKPNNLLQGVEKLGEGKLHLPEDVCVGKDGQLYTATRDGWIKRQHVNGTWEDWKMVGGSSLLGLAKSMDGDIIVCDGNQGLLKVGEGGLTVLAKDVEGTQILFADDAIEASDGSIYFSDASSKFGLQDWFMDVLEAGSNGRVLKYDPVKKRASILLADVGFANGVALSPEEDYLLVAETLKFRCLKYWLKGEKKGSVEVFVDNLPGAPDNINLAPDGSFWIALIDLRSPWLDLIHPFPLAKRSVAAFPKVARELSRTVGRRAMVINVDADGKMKTVLDDSDGRVVSFVTSALEHEGHLYLGSLYMDFIGKFPL